MPAPSVDRWTLFVWLGALYAAEGLGNALVTGAAPFLYKTSGLDLGALGLLSLLELPWMLKFLWAPWIDRAGTRRRWTAGSQIGMALTLVGAAALPSGTVPPAAWAVFLLAAVFGATQDIAIDGYAVDAVPRRLVGPANGVRVAAYRLAAVLGAGFLPARADVLGWSGVWLVASGLFVLLAWLSTRAPESPRPPTTTSPLAGLRVLAGRRGVAGFALFVLLFKVGDYAMSRMTKPCLLDHGFSKIEVGDIVTPLEVVATIVGAAIGAFVVRRVGIFRALWTLGALQAISNLSYALGAATGKPVLWAAVVVEPLCTGLGTAPFLSLLMVSCDRRDAAAQFALWTAIMGLGRIAVGSISGYGASHFGYATYFAATFVLALPAFALLPSVSRWIERCAADAAEPTTMTDAPSAA
jgi:MFS transporter, PAT family, beta-lactamase induction signal transducer AmpG